MPSASKRRRPWCFARQPSSAALFQLDQLDLEQVLFVEGVELLLGQLPPVDLACIQGVQIARDMVPVAQVDDPGRGPGDGDGHLDLGDPGELP